MLTIFGHSYKACGFCDGYSRRSFLTIGGAAMGGLGLSQLLEMEAQAGIGRSHKAIINIYLPGGPSHMDRWELRPNAPAEIRGEFEPTQTNVPGMDICELFPNLAKNADKFALIRSPTATVATMVINVSPAASAATVDRTAVGRWLA